MPYVAWYQNTLAIEGSPTQAYHAEHFGADFPYENFRPLFEEEAAKWDPIQWADLFRDAGARYVVLVTKRHDGYALWPSAVGTQTVPTGTARAIWSVISRRRCAAAA